MVVGGTAPSTSTVNRDLALISAALGRLVRLGLAPTNVAKAVKRGREPVRARPQDVRDHQRIAFDHARGHCSAHGVEQDPERAPCLARQLGPGHVHRVGAQCRGREPFARPVPEVGRDLGLDAFGIHDAPPVLADLQRVVRPPRPLGHVLRPGAVREPRVGLAARRVELTRVHRELRPLERAARMERRHVFALLRAVGYGALSSNTTGGANSALGFRALFSNTTGSPNTALGVDALAANTTGNFNTAVGYSALDSNTTGGNNIALGTAAATLMLITVVIILAPWVYVRYVRSEGRHA